MLNNLTNFFNLIRGRKIKTTLVDSDLIPIGVRDPRFDGNYQPSAIEFADLQSQVGGLQTVSVDGVTITGDGTPGNPLVAVVEQPTRVVIQIGPTQTTYSDGRPPLAAGLNNMGAGITLLPGTPGVLLDPVKIFAKYIPNTSNYSSTATFLQLLYGPRYITVEKSFLTGFSTKLIKLPDFLGQVVSNFVKASNTGSTQVNVGIILYTDTGASFTTGDGTLEITIDYYKVNL